MDGTVLSVVLALSGLMAFGYAAASWLRLANRRRVDRELDATGVPARGVVVEVEPVSRETDQPAGHPVVVEYADRDGERHRIYDQRGLGGYLVRAGGEVTVRHRPDDPHTARVEELLLPSGRVPVPVDDQPLLPASTLVTLLLGVAAEGAAVLVATGRVGTDDLREWPPLLLLAGMALIIASVVSLVRHRARTGGPRVEVTGMVTDAWQQPMPGGRGRARSVCGFMVHFVTADGREVHMRYPVATTGFRPARGQPVVVRHHPAEPTRFEVRGAGRPEPLDRVVPLLLGCGLLVAAVVIWLVAVVQGWLDGLPPAAPPSP